MCNRVEPQVLYLSYGSPLIPDIQLHQLKKVSKVCNTGIYSMSDPNKECIYKFNHTSKSTV